MFETHVVPFGILTEVIPHCVKHLQKPVELVKERAGMDDLVRDIYNGQLHLVCVVEGGEVTGALTFMEQTYSKSKYLCVTMFGGDYGVLEKAGEALMFLLEREAKARGCQGMEWVGRKGWRNHAREFGYEEYQTIYKRTF